ncbi:MAG TPA: hypothetical protein VEK38_03215 [Candidatus Bathyarchaeia archaeon]|nr:hypothetical protein [Candidatus Bathyarchaeia archaeon]
MTIMRHAYGIFLCTFFLPLFTTTAAAQTPTYYHTTFSIEACNGEIIRSAPALLSYIKTVLETLDLSPYQQPIIKYYGSDVEGFVVCQFLDKGTITLFINNAENTASIYIISSQPFDKKEAYYCLQECLQK